MGASTSLLCSELGRLAAEPTPPYAVAPSVSSEATAARGAGRSFAWGKPHPGGDIELDTLADARPVADVHGRHRPVRREDAVAQYHTFISRR